MALLKQSRETAEIGQHDFLVFVQGEEQKMQ